MRINQLDTLRKTLEKQQICYLTQLDKCVHHIDLREGRGDQLLPSYVVCTQLDVISMYAYAFMSVGFVLVQEWPQEVHGFGAPLGQCWAMLSLYSAMSGLSWVIWKYLEYVYL